MARRASEQRWAALCVGALAWSLGACASQDDVEPNSRPGGQAGADATDSNGAAGSGGAETRAQAGQAGFAGAYQAGSDASPPWLLALHYAPVYAIAVDTAGDIVAVADPDGPVTIGDDTSVASAGSDQLVVKLDAAGRVLWTRLLPTNSEYGVCDVATTPKDEIVVGCVVGSGPTEDALDEERDIRITKLDRNGETLWTRTLGGPGWQQPAELAVDADGAIYVAGGSEGTPDFGGGARPTAGRFDAFLAKLDADGTHVFSSVFGDDDAQQTQDVAVMTNGDVVIVGAFGGHIDLGGGELTVTGFDTRNFFLARFDAAGHPLWSQRLRGLGYFPEGNLAATADDGFVLCGSFDGRLEIGDATYQVEDNDDQFLLARFDRDGSVQWSQSVGGTGIDECRSAAIDSDGNIALTGSFSGVVNFDGEDLGAVDQTSVLFARFSARGAHIESSGFANGRLSFGSAIGLLPTDRAVVAGWTGENRLGLGFAEINGPAGFVASMPM